MTPLVQMSGTPLTKPLHNVSVQTGTGFHAWEADGEVPSLRLCGHYHGRLGSLWGWRFFAICNVAPWLLSHQSGPLAQGFDQGISATPTPIALIVLGTCLVAALASFISRYQLCKLLDTCINLRDPSRKLVAPIRPNGRRVFSKIERSC